MLTIVVSLAILCAGPKGAASHDWLQNLLASPKAKKVAAFHIPKRDKVEALPAAGKGDPAAAGPGATGFRTAQANTMFDAAEQARLDAANAVDVQAGALMSQGNYEAAYTTLSAFRRERPDAAHYTDDMAADCANLTGRYDETFQLLVPQVRR